MAYFQAKSGQNGPFEGPGGSSWPAGMQDGSMDGTRCCTAAGYSPWLVLLVVIRRVSMAHRGHFQAKTGQKEGPEGPDLGPGWPAGMQDGSMDGTAAVLLVGSSPSVTTGLGARWVQKWSLPG